MLGVILPRIIDSGHQVASTYVFSARDPSVFKDLGTASSHSFGNFVVPESRGGFLGVDLGDNYPRGVHLHRFNPLGMANRVVYTYKTVHLPFPRKEGSAVYKGISTSGKTYYTWSNDNGVYTELGGVVEGQVSYSVIFATDRSPEGRVLDNRHAVEGHPDDPRDLAMLRIIKDYDRVPGSGCEVSDAILAGMPEGFEGRDRRLLRLWRPVDPAAHDWRDLADEFQARRLRPRAAAAPPPRQHDSHPLGKDRALRPRALRDPRRRERTDPRPVGLPHAEMAIQPRRPPAGAGRPHLPAGHGQDHGRDAAVFRVRRPRGRAPPRQAFPFAASRSSASRPAAPGAVAKSLAHIVCGEMARVSRTRRVRKAAHGVCRILSALARRKIAAAGTFPGVKSSKVRGTTAAKRSDPHMGCYRPDIPDPCKEPVPVSTTLRLNGGALKEAGMGRAIVLIWCCLLFVAAAIGSVVSMGETAAQQPANLPKGGAVAGPTGDAQRQAAARQWAAELTATFDQAVKEHAAATQELAWLKPGQREMLSSLQSPGSVANHAPSAHWWPGPAAEGRSQVLADFAKKLQAAGRNDEVAVCLDLARRYLTHSARSIARSPASLSAIFPCKRSMRACCRRSPHLNDSAKAFDKARLEWGQMTTYITRLANGTSVADFARRALASATGFRFANAKAFNLWWQGNKDYPHRLWYWAKRWAKLPE